MCKLTHVLLAYSKLCKCVAYSWHQSFPFLGMIHQYFKVTDFVVLLTALIKFDILSKSLYISCTAFTLHGNWSQTVPWLTRVVAGLLTMDTRVQIQGNLCGGCREQSLIVQFFPCTRTRPVSIISPVLYTRSFTSLRYCIIIAIDRVFKQGA